MIGYFIIDPLIPGLHLIEILEIHMIAAEIGKTHTLSKRRELPSMFVNINERVHLKQNWDYWNLMVAKQLCFGWEGWKCSLFGKSIIYKNPVGLKPKLRHQANHLKCKLFENTRDLLIQVNFPQLAFLY